MKRRQLATVFALLSLMQNLAYANVIVDLPDPGMDDGGLLDIPIYDPETPSNAPVPPSKTLTEYSGNISLTSLTRKSGGDRYKIELNKAITLSRLEITVTANRLKIHSASVITENGDRVLIREFKDSAVIATNKTLVSENLNLQDRVQSIEFYFESYSGNADISLKTFSRDDVAKMTLTDQPASSAEVRPVTPSAPPPPATNAGQNRPQPPPAPAPVRSGGQCESNVCVGDRMMYKFVHLGQVVGIYSRGVVVVRFSDGSVGNVSVNQLTKKINCLDNICVNEKVMYNVTYPAVVTEVYGHGTALIKFADGSTYVTSLRSLTKPINCLENICVGDKMMYNYASDVVVVNVYSNRTAAVRFSDGSALHTSLGNLSNKTNCQGGVCAGDNVMYGYTSKSKVLAVYANNTANVKFEDGSTYTVNLSQLTKPISCLSNICAGQTMMYSYTSEVRVLEVYSNNTSLVIFSDRSKYVVNLKQLTAKVHCQQNICAGQNMMYGYTSDVRVQAVYSNNTASVKFDDGSVHTVNLSQLTGKITCMDGFCAGDRALYNNTTVKILSVYSNRTASVLINGSSYTINLSQLRKLR